MLKNAGHYASYLVIRVFVCVLQALRIETCEKIAELLATLCTYVIPLRRSLMEENLRHALPELDERERRQLAWRMWRHLYLLVAEVAHAPRKIHDTNWRDYIFLSNSNSLMSHLISGRSNMIISAHFGNFELSGFVVGLLGFPSYTVARTLDNPYLNEFVGRFRSYTGQKIIPKQGGYEKIVEVLDGGGTMAFLADQYAGSKGCWIEFFGRPASAHKAIALFALHHQSIIHVGSARRLSKPLRYALLSEGTLDTTSDDPATSGVRQLTEWYTSRLERMIRRHPEQYWWIHDRWKDRRATKKKRSKVRAAA